MTRWHMTLGLGTAAVAAAALAPRLLSTSPPAPPLRPSPTVQVDDLSVLPVSNLPAGPVSVSLALDRSQLNAGVTNERFLTISIEAAAEGGETIRRPVDLAVALDASGSMSAAGKIDYAKRAAKLLASSMEPGDSYSLVVFNDDATTIVPAGEVQDPAVVHRAISGVYEGGGTNLFAGMDAGAKQLRSATSADRAARLIVLSDGIANVGITDPEALARFTSGLTASNLTTSTVGLGLDYNEDVLARIADVGGGTYDFVDDPSELERVFKDELARSAQLVARGTEVTLTLPDGVELVDMYGWDPSVQGNTWTVRMGDLATGTSRKIVTRVRIRGGSATETVSVASAHVDYWDLIDGQKAAASETLSAISTDDPAAVSASLNKKAAIEANRAWGSWYLDESARAWAGGDRDKAEQLAVDGASVLEDAGIAFDDDALVEEAAHLRRQQALYETTAPTSDEGKHAIKRAKEMYRGRSR